MTRPTPAAMNPLAHAWAERELKRLEIIQLRQLAPDLSPLTLFRHALHWGHGNTGG